MTIYIDSLFLTNFFMDTAILFSVYIFRRRRDATLRILAGAVISAIYGTLIFFPAMSFAYSIIGKVLVSLIIAFVAFRPYGARDYITTWLLFWLSSAMCGGLILAISVFSNFGNVMQTTISNCVMYIKLNPFLLTFGSMLLYFFIEFYRRTCIRNFSKDKIILKLKILYEKNEYFVSALIDTGCELTDPLSGDPVIVAEKSAFKNIADVMDKISIKTALGEGVLSLIFPEKIECINNVYKIKDKVPVALSGGRFTFDGLYNAVINPDAVEEIKLPVENRVYKLIK